MGKNRAHYCAAQGARIQRFKRVVLQMVTTCGLRIVLALRVMAAAAAGSTELRFGIEWVEEC
jgi:hypothetical protein